MGLAHIVSELISERVRYVLRKCFFWGGGERFVFSARMMAPMHVIEWWSWGPRLGKVAVPIQDAAEEFRGRTADIATEASFGLFKTPAETKETDQDNVPGSG